MLKCVLNAWILLLFVAHLGFPLIYGCGNDWFGPRCQYQCHCSNTKCNTDGLCTNGSKCVTGWFGPACQYVDLANSETVVKEKGDVVSTVTDGDESSCLDQSVSDVTVTWNTSFSFTWLRVHTKTTESIKGLNVNFKNNISSSSTPCENRRDITVSDTAIDVYCDTTGTTIQVIITGQGLQSLCSLYISGGRNVALKENTTQSSTYSLSPISSVSSNAVNGDKSGDFKNGQCSCTEQTGDKKPNLNLTFTNSVTVSRIFLYSRTDTESDHVLSRFTKFILRVFGRANKELFSFQDKDQAHRRVYTVQLTESVSNVSMINVEATSIKRGVRMLTLCELEVFGDSVCPPGKFGLGCDRSCHCADESEQCLVSTGGCVSGCAVGFTGEGCQDIRVCPPGLFGEKCETKCNCANKSEQCGVIDGACKSGCATFFSGKGCQEKICPPGLFGEKCETKCNCANKSEQCGVIDGACKSGCATFFSGKGCQEKTCPPGLFGEKCETKCNCANKSEQCGVIDGACKSGCATDFSGKGCQEKSNETPLVNKGCAPGLFGEKCEAKCNCANRTEQCNVINGWCKSGCATNFTGKECHEKICEIGWFGLGCPYKCHCSENKCNFEGLCASGSKCVSDWFGPACQYADQLASDTFVKDNQTPVILLDGDESTCLDQGPTEVKLTWTTPFVFTWLRAHGKNISSLSDLKFSFKQQSNSPPTPCKGRRDTKVSDTTMDIICDMADTTTQIIITGTGVRSLCSLYISGGMNVALRGNTKQSSTLINGTISAVSSNAVDGDKTGDYNKGGCSSTNAGDKQPSLTLTFTSPVAVTKYLLYNRIDDANTEQMLLRLQGFTVRGLSRDNKKLYTFTDTNKVAQRVYTVQPVKPVSQVAVVDVWATSKNLQTDKYLTICELEVFGECETGWFGLGCQYNCYCSENKCNNDGLCASGSKCGKGWFGPACQYVDQLVSTTFVKDNPALLMLLDGDESTCLDQRTTEVTLTWKKPFLLTWFRAHGKDFSSLSDLKFSFKRESDSTPTPCKGRRDTKVSDTTIDIYCDMTETITQVIITGTGVRSLCSLYISGGRNMALRGSTKQSSTMDLGKISTVSSNAVDGDKTGDHKRGGCTHTDAGDLQPNLNLTFIKPVTINRILLYNRVGAGDNVYRRFRGFIVRGFSRANRQLFTHTDTEPTVQMVYTVQLDQPVPGVSVVNVEAASGDNKGNKYLTLCELEVFGDTSL